MSPKSRPHGEEMLRCTVSQASEPLFSSTQGPLFLTISHVNRRPNRNHGPRHGLGGRRDAAVAPPSPLLLQIPSGK